METIDHSNIPEQYHKIDISMFPGAKPVYDWIRTGKGFLYIYGATGTGKTALSCAIKRRCVEIEDDCRLIFASDLFLRIKNSFGNDSLEKDGDIIFDVAPDPKIKPGSCFTIFDDVGAQKISDYVKEVWYTILDRRYRFNQKTIFTGNYKISELSRLMEDRIASRIGSGMVFSMDGDDLRIKGLSGRDLTQIF